MSLGLESALMAEETLLRAEALESAPDALEAAIARVQGGEVEAFQELMEHTEAKVLAVAWRLLGDRDLARDAAQETYLRVFRSLARYRRGEGFQAWLYRIAVNVCFDLARKRGPFPVAESALETLRHAHPGHEHAEQVVLLEERRALVQEALRVLTLAERSALVLRDLEGLSTEEAARVLGVRAVTVRSQISSARAKMQAFCARGKGGRP
jgi:RNA polymerase sigma-70 factor (ECF subfamily)